jgi:hypothetical protein
MERPDGLTPLTPAQMCVRERGDGTIDVARHIDAAGYHHWEPLVLADLPDDLASIKRD